MKFSINLSTLYGESRRAEMLSQLLSKVEISAFIKEIAHNTYKWSQIYVPVETGELKNTSYIRGSGSIYTICYPAPYAPYVHEMMNKRHAMPTQAKFLEDGFKMAMYTAIRTYGRENIPDFNVSLLLDTKSGVTLFISSPRAGGNNMHSWRRLVA